MVGHALHCARAREDLFRALLNEYNETMFPMQIRFFWESEKSRSSKADEISEVKC